MFSGIRIGLHYSSIRIGLHFSSIRIGLHYSSIRTGLHFSSIRIGLHYSSIRIGLRYSSIRIGLHYSSIRIGLRYSSIPVGLHYSNISVSQEIFKMPQFKIYILKLYVFSLGPIPTAEPIKRTPKFQPISSSRCNPSAYQSYDYNPINTIIRLRHTTYTGCSRVTSADKFKAF